MCRPISAAQNAILTVQAQGGAQKTAVRMRAKDNGGNFRDLGNYALGNNMLKSLVWREAVDDPGITWEATVVREAELLSLAPFMQTSGLNRGFNIANAYAPLLQVGRQVRFEWALHAEDDPMGLSVFTMSWVLAFTGYIDTIDAGGSGEITITGRGAEAVLIDNYIERERVYAFGQGANADRGCYVFEPSKAYAVGDRMLPTSTNSNLHFYRCTTAGTTAATEPAWPTGASSTVTSGTAVFTESGATSTSTGTAVETVMQQLLNDNGTGVTLWCPVSPGWLVKWFLVGRQPLFDELRALADQIGWCIRYVWDPSATDPLGNAGDLRLKLYDPNRSTTTSLRTFQKNETKISKAETSILDVRNVVQVVYSDSQDLDAGGFPKRKTVVVSDATSIAKYGRRFCEIAEASSSNIDTLTEATALANAVLSDLKEPVAEFEAKLRLFPFTEATDLYTLAANGVQFDVDQKLASVSYEHTHNSKTSSTTITLRGTPSSASSTWLQAMTDGAAGDVHQLTALENAAPLTATADATPVGGARIITSWAAARAAKDTELELHLSTSAGFVPTSGTFVAGGKERIFEVGNLDPNKVMYGKIVAVTRNAARRVRSGSSPEFSFSGGRAQATHLNPEVFWKNLPLNGSFETSFDPSGPPDLWTAGSWGVREFLMNDANGASGANYVRLLTTDAVTAALMSSAIFPINQSDNESVSKFGQIIYVWAKMVAGSGTNFQIITSYFDYARAPISSTTTSYDLATNVGFWKKYAGVISPPSGARFAKVAVKLAAGASGREAMIDSVECHEVLEAELNPAWNTVVVGAGANDYKNSWIPFGGVYAGARYSKDWYGRVRLSGLVKSGTVGASIFTLPAGFRPATNENVYQIVVSNNAVGVVEVQSSGVVLPQAGSNVHFSLEGISFLAGN